ncbi:hypothetical protein [Pseudooceanicola sediminis]|uniref:hypothetical protein n=1 Tax=Pseudooceanicola sediminis TaxID=2211117 RepID=UPI003899FFA6
MLPTRQNNAYLLDISQGASVPTIPVGHTRAARRSVLGERVERSFERATGLETALVANTGEARPVIAPDQVLVSGRLATGAPVSLYYRRAGRAGSRASNGRSTDRVNACA